MSSRSQPRYSSSSSSSRSNQPQFRYSIAPGPNRSNQPQPGYASASNSTRGSQNPPPPPPPPGYRVVAGLEVQWAHRDQIDQANSDNLNLALRDGYTDAHEYMLIVDGDRATREIQANMTAFDAPGRLMVMTYVGHGYESYGRLYGTRYDQDDETPDEEHVSDLDITALQLHARDNCVMDFLFIIECCDSSFFPSPRDAPRSSRADGHTVEILAAGAGDVTTRASHDFCHRVAYDLRRVREPPGTFVAERIQRIYNANANGPGSYASVGRQHGRINLRVRR